MPDRNGVSGSLQEVIEDLNRIPCHGATARLNAGSKDRNRRAGRHGIEEGEVQGLTWMLTGIELRGPEKGRAAAAKSQSRTGVAVDGNEPVTVHLFGRPSLSRAEANASRGNPVHSVETRGREDGPNVRRTLWIWMREVRGMNERRLEEPILNG